MKTNNWGNVFGWGLLAVLGIAVLSSISQNPKLSPNLRFIAQTAEGQLVQDLETGIIHLLV
jgi:hypothetical protein